MKAPETTRVRLIPHRPEELLALTESSEQFEKLSGRAIAKGLREFMVSDDVSPVWKAELRKATGADPWRWGFGVVHKETNTVIGMAGFKGAPANGVVEISYGIAPGFQNQGYATEAAKALSEHAFADSAVKTVIAHTLPLPNPSTSVLTKCGFKQVGTVVDPEDGPVWRWELARGV